MIYQPARTSITRHTVPDWYHDAKLGIFIHWGLYSVPAWAPASKKDIITMFQDEGFETTQRKNPYAEWYLNSMRLEGSPTWQHHRDVYGENFRYEDFQPIFEVVSARMNPDAWADFFEKAGARYVVMVTKHHDGYLMWNSRHPNPRCRGYQAQRDLVGEVCTAVRQRGLRMGLYYSGLFDWSFLHVPIDSLYTFVLNMSQTKEYIAYTQNHYIELIERYQPSILWNDIGYPAGADLPALIAYYYNQITEGVINDRWNQIRVPRNALGRGALRLLVWLLTRRGFDYASAPVMCHYDFRTPEYVTYPEARSEKWEATRGMGMSFGINHNETADDMLTTDELVRFLVDVVSKNGNLLLNVGPLADGSIPAIQEEPLRGLGAWLRLNGEAIYGTRPWKRAEGVTSDGIPVRFTSRNQETYVLVMDPLVGKQEIRLRDLQIPADSTVRWLGNDQLLVWQQQDTDLYLELPSDWSSGPGDSVRVFCVDRTNNGNYSQDKQRIR